MITFEEFFYKKKIDLQQLQQAEPGLFAEFENHYSLMGEKSFDHSKKFWFNKLRRLYHLKEEKPVEKSQLAARAEPLDSPSKEIKPGYTPRFKQKTAQPEVRETNTENEPEERAKIQPKPAYQPRFKPHAIKQETTAEEGAQPSETTKPVESASEDENEKDEKPKDLVKPAYKPRFKPPDKE